MECDLQKIPAVKESIIWRGVVGAVIFLSVVFSFIFQKSSHRFLLILFSIAEDIVLFEIMK